MRRTAAKAVTLGLPHYLLSILAIQGTAFASQFLMARMLGPQDFGVVRSVEAIVAIALVFGAAGMPSLAIKSVAEAGSVGVRGRVLLRLLSLTVAVSLITAAVVALLDGLFFDAVIASYARVLVWIIPISAIARTALNYHQGVRSVHRVSFVAAFMSVVSLVVVVVLVSRWQLTGWLVARYVSETLLALTLLWTVRQVLRSRTTAPPEFSHGKLLHLGLAIASSLLVRTCIDNMGVLGMGVAGVAKADIGYFAIASLVASALMLVPGAVANLSLPAIIESLGARQRAERVTGRLLAGAMVFAVPMVLGLLWLAPAMARVLAPAYLPGIPIIRVLLIAVPLRVATSIAGAVLLATGRVHSTLVINLCTLVVGMAALVLLIPKNGAIGAAYGTVLMEGFSTLCFVWWAARAIRLVPSVRTVRL
jgi:O-antigen/teichoic acid export membrane protein